MNAQWEQIKSSLTFSHILCMVCREQMYYGTDSLVTTGQRYIFSCRCHDKISIQDKCAQCGKLVETKPLKEHVIRFKCSCGHNDVCLVKNIPETTRL